MGIAGVVLQTVLFFFFAGPQAPAQPQPPPPRTGLILGRVVDAATNRPVPGAIVVLDGVSMVMPGAALPASQPRAMTNANGQFVFRKLPKGLFGLSVIKSGYSDGAYGRRRPGGSQMPLELDEGQRTSDVVIRVWKYGSISGTVVDEAGDPLIGVVVRAFTRRLIAGQRRFASAAAASTDDRGVYRFGNLTAGEYVVAFVAREVSMPAATMELTLNAPANDPKFQEITRERMSLGGFMGQPGSPYAVQTGTMIRQLDMTGPVPPPVLENEPIYVYPTLFYPSAPSAARARVVTIESGQQRENVDLMLRPSRALRVSGLVVGPEGPVSNIALRLVPADDEARTDVEVSATMTGPSGEFTFLGVTPGQYAIKVVRVPRPAPTQPPSQTETQIQIGGGTVFIGNGPMTAAPAPAPPDAPTLCAEVSVGVAEADVNGVVVTLQTGARLTGHYEFDGTAERPAPADLVRIPIMLERTDAAPGAGPFNRLPPGRADESGAFRTYGVPPGAYIVRVGSSPGRGWALKSVTIEGRDVSEIPITLRAAEVANAVITFTDRPTKLTGTVRAASGSPDPGALVIVFPVEPSGWSQFGLNPRRLQSTRPWKSGAYTFTGLPAGDYYVAAINEDGIGQWQDPQFLEGVSRSATQVRLLDGDTRTQDLKSAGAIR
jgi:uncharacterized protein (DUF2141 family)